jgi:hypothetical protein
MSNRPVCAYCDKVIKRGEEVPLTLKYIYEPDEDVFVHRECEMRVLSAKASARIFNGQFI